MKVFFSVIFRFLNKIVEWLSHINLRGVVAIVGICLIITAPRNTLTEGADKLMLKASQWLFKTPLGSASIAIVEVPKSELELWQTDIHASGQLAALLSNVLNSSEAKVGLLIQSPIDTGAGAAESFIEELLAKSKSSAMAEVKALVDRKYLLMDLLKNKRVTIGVDGTMINGQKPVLIAKNLFDKIPENWRWYLWPACDGCFNSAAAPAIARPEVEQFTLVSNSTSHQQLVYRHENGDFYPTYLLQLLKSIQGLNSDENLTWHLDKGLELGEKIFPLSLNGTFISINALADRMSPPIDRFPLSEALARSAFPEIVIVAASGSEQAEVIAKSIYSIKHNDFMHSPWWTLAVNLVLLMFVTLYLYFLVPRISKQMSIAITALVIFILLAVQIFFIALQKVWVPTALPLVWMVVGHFMLIVWLTKQHRIQRLVNNADAICIENARRLIEHNNLSQARQQLQACTNREPLLKTLYEISEAYTQQKDFNQAVAVLSEIRKKNRSYKDTEQKIQVLNSMLKTQGMKRENGLEKTAVLSQEMLGPRTFGRYRVEREIGRGAMGQVYLCHDPSISRNVAVKAINYDNFQQKEINDIKGRFFKEAKAAGRLSHPSIVSVYDVGEDNGVAFIAMDYAEGNPLSSFVTKDNLLPVFEVYRIICEVAIALEYAHENNIVHRDIKPGNIIYNPSPFQVKVTDFGIARLVDDSKTNTGEILGSPLYMAPEQLKGKKVNRAADIFSLGVTFYQLLTGQLPFTGDNLAALTYEIIHGRPKNVRTVRKNLPASAARIINQALQKDPEQRYDTAAEFAATIKKAIKRDFASNARKIGFI
ncbi:Serine/threonine-protein kinase PrkC [Thalassocella blandensis]|nr:Serine/threonine-protein kinase PrkC [Thalassocella blandensis]